MASRGAAMHGSNGMQTTKNSKMATEKMWIRTLGNVWIQCSCHSGRLYWAKWREKINALYGLIDHDATSWQMTLVSSIIFSQPQLVDVIC